MATLTVSTVDAGTGVNITDTLTAAASGGDVFANDGKTLFVVYNGDASPITVTFASAATAGRDSLAVADPAPTVEASKHEVFGPFEQGIFNNSSGQVSVTYSAVTSVTVVPIKLSY